MGGTRQADPPPLRGRPGKNDYPLSLKDNCLAGELADMARMGVACLKLEGRMYDTQINRGDYYREQSVRTITSTETVEASRGILTDRNGQVLVSNRQTYALTFDVSLLSSEDDENAAILRLIQLCRQRGVIWNDNLPMTPPVV